MHPRLAPIVFLLYVLLARMTAFAGLTFSVSFDEKVRKEPATGRLVVYLIREGAQVGASAPADGPFWYDPQPLYGINVHDLKPRSCAIIDDSATAFGPVPSALPAGRYRVQAVLDLHHLDSSWRREAGNLYSDPIRVEIKPGATTSVPIPLSKVVRSGSPRRSDRFQIFGIRSKLLSDFHGRQVMLRAGVLFPEGFDPSRSYPAVYEVPGFGGNHLDGSHSARRRRGQANAQLARSVFWITLDPESPNGHTLFADSAVNGPCGEALVRELIPALEQKYNLVAESSARLLRGHSSGGWSALWLTLQYPQVFGACWSSSPDPVDFRRFERINIYENDNAYTDADGNEIPSVRDDGRVTLSVRGENQQEEVLGPGNSSAQQWDSWQAVFGSRDSTGWPKPLFDVDTGVIDRGEAEHYKRYDIGLLLRDAPHKFAPILLQRVRLICGGSDDFYLNEAVELLRADLQQITIENLPQARYGYIRIVPGADHGSVLSGEALSLMHQEMLDHLRRSGHIQ